MTTTLILHTILALLLLILPLGALYLLDRPSMKPFATALTKGFIQLLIFSLIVWAVYKVDNIWLSIGWLLVMAVWAGFLVITKCKLTILQYLFPVSS